MSDTPQAEPARTRRSSRKPVTPAPATPAPALTRAELRRRAQPGQATVDSPAAEAVLAAAPPLTRRSARTRVAPVVDEIVEVPLEQLADLAPDALRVPDLPVEVPVVVETADIGTDPASLATGPIVVPRRRARVRRDAGAPAADGADAFAVPAAADIPATLPVDDDTTAPVQADPDAFTVPPIPVRETSIEDEFEAAARLFSFTGETPAQVAATALADDAVEPAEDAVPRRRRFGLKRVATASFSIGVLGCVGLLTVGMTTPLEAVAAAKGASASITRVAGDVAADESAEDIQAYVAPAEVQGTTIERSEDYETTTIAELAAESGISNFSNFFVNDPNSPIQWPFAVGVPITYGFGMRSGTMHEGLDFVPGAGSPVQAIADGTVRIATESGGAYGVTVVIDHVIDGELVSSRYAHMQYGSLQVEAGDEVTVGTFIGRTGNTGRSFGAHTHFEILQNGTTAIDPLPWLREHAGG